MYPASLNEIWRPSVASAFSMPTVALLAVASEFSAYWNSMEPSSPRIIWNVMVPAPVKRWAFCHWITKRPSGAAP